MAQALVNKSGRFLHVSIGVVNLNRHMVVTDGKVNEGALRLSTPKPLSGNLYLPHGVEFNPPSTVVHQRAGL
jgi:hypothetical protein